MAADPEFVAEACKDKVALLERVKAEVTTVQ
jgi:hypothetical protein